MDNKQELPLRIGVGVILLNDKNEVFVGKRIDNQEGNYWQMPQGGIEENENFLNAAKRELEEETGIKTVKLIKELDNWLTYDVPENLLGKIWNGKYRGQKQKWYIMKFMGKNNEINIKTKQPEFLEWKWISPSMLPVVVVNFKVNLYIKLKEELNSLNLS
jgi:putative (di)nucleoside polyphosphate hydrolase|tara:strand:+ start:783 stop:1262 length:480 start_codon:yes stop_codon:yes gene_type:complete